MLLPPPRAAVGVLPVSIFRDARVVYVLRRLGEAADEFFDAALLQLAEVMPDAPQSQQIRTMASAFARTVPQWSPAVIKQRVDRILDLARDFEPAVHAAFAVYVKDAYAEDLRGRRRKVQICMPRLSDFVHAFFSRVVVCPEVRRGSYFDPASTAARNFAVSNALLDALADMCVDNVRVADMPDPQPARPYAAQQQQQQQQQPQPPHTTQGQHRPPSSSRASSTFGGSASDSDSLEDDTLDDDDDDDGGDGDGDGVRGGEGEKGGAAAAPSFPATSAAGSAAGSAAAAAATGGAAATGAAFAALAAAASQSRQQAAANFPRTTARFNTFMPPQTMAPAAANGAGSGGGMPGFMAGSFAPLGAPSHHHNHHPAAAAAPPNALGFAAQHGFAAPDSPSSSSAASGSATRRASGSRRRPSKSQTQGAMALIRKLRKMDA